MQATKSWFSNLFGGGLKDERELTEAELGILEEKIQANRNIDEHLDVLGQYLEKDEIGGLCLSGSEMSFNTAAQLTYW
jgi:hypothetical protein